MILPSAPVCLIIPTHDHPTTLPFAIKSVLGQTMSDLTLVVIGDGVSDETRRATLDAIQGDKRAVFLDAPKSPRHGERVRDSVIRGIDAGFIAYLGDDDILLPRHLEQMLVDISGHDFVHPLPLFVLGDGAIRCMPTDLSNPACVDWHLGPKVRNAVSLTGVVHTKEAYLRLPYGWRQTPSDRPTDHYMWEQFLQSAGFSAVTSRASTTVKLVSWDRMSWSSEARGQEAETWWQRTNEPGFQQTWEKLTSEAVYQAAVVLELERARLEDNWWLTYLMWRLERRRGRAKAWLRRHRDSRD